MNDGGPAFPIAEQQGVCAAWPGMSLRDYFAAAALTGIIACHADSDPRLPEDDKAAKWAYEYAGAMLAAREPKPAVVGPCFPPDWLG